MSNKDFNIVEGVLIKYTGTDKNVVIPDGVVLIGLNAFSGCSNLTSVTLPTSLETLGDYAFSSCGNLKVIYKGTSEQYRRIDMDSTWMNATSVTLEYLG